MHTEKDIFLCDEHSMREKIKQILEDNQCLKIDICADSINAGSLHKIKRWIGIARELCREQEERANQGDIQSIRDMP